VFEKSARLAKSSYFLPDETFFRRNNCFISRENNEVWRKIGHFDECDDFANTPWSIGRKNY